MAGLAAARIEAPLVLARCGMWGGVSLAAALALPLTTDAGNPFPERDLIVFLTFAVIFMTLVVQGLTLPALIRGRRIGDDGAEADEELRARLAATGAALARIDRLAEREWTARTASPGCAVPTSTAGGDLPLVPARSRTTTGTRTARWPIST